MQRGIIIGAETNIAGAVKHLLEDVVEANWEIHTDVININSEVLQSASIIVFNFLEEDDSLNKLLVALRLIPSNKLVVFGYVDEDVFVGELHKVGVQHYLPFNSSRSEVSQTVNRILTAQTR
jgi:hypothetical protein